MLGCGAELKSTFCLAAGGRAWVGQHIGDLKNWETLSSFREGVAHFERLFAIEPEVVAHDLHPDYLSTGYAREREGVELLAVQHHHAHLAACLAEHGERGPAIGAIFDGSGHGADGTVWGGELLVGGLASFERAGFLFPVRLPGGDAAVREPWRMACAWLVAALGIERPEPPPGLARAVERRSWDAVCELAAGGLNSPLTTSAGRLFDAVAALCGMATRVEYEGQAAIELEAAAATGRGDRPYPLALIESGPEGPVILDPRETVRAILGDIRAGVEAAVIGDRFHAALARASAEALAAIAAREGIGLTVLSGGVFANRLLIERTAAAPRRRRAASADPGTPAAERRRDRVRAGRRRDFKGWLGMSFEFLFGPLEDLDSWLTGLFAGAPLLLALGLAFVLGIRHASDPDHLVAVTSLVAADDGDARSAVRLGAWWGLGHAAILLGIGLPLIALKSELPASLESAAEKGVGVVIVLLAGRVTWKWLRGDYRVGRHAHAEGSDVAPDARHRHLRRGDRGDHRHVSVRTPRQAVAIGLLHGLAGTGAVVLLLIAALPNQLEAAAALAVFAPMSIVSMAGFTGAFAWVLTRPLVEPVYRGVLIPALGMFGLLFGLWYVGIL